MFHPQASQEYAQAAEYFMTIAPELSRRFYDEIERLITSFASTRIGSSSSVRPSAALWPGSSHIRSLISMNRIVCGSWQSCMANDDRVTGANGSNSQLDCARRELRAQGFPTTWGPTCPFSLYRPHERIIPQQVSLPKTRDSSGHWQSFLPPWHRPGSLRP